MNKIVFRIAPDVDQVF